MKVTVCFYHLRSSSLSQPKLSLPAAVFSVGLPVSPSPTGSPTLNTAVGRLAQTGLIRSFCLVAVVFVLTLIISFVQISFKMIYYQKINESDYFAGRLCCVVDTVFQNCLFNSCSKLYTTVTTLKYSISGTNFLKPIVPRHL